MSVHAGSEYVQLKEETAAAVAKAALPVSVTSGLIFGVSISDAIQWVTLIFLILQIGLLIPKYLDMFRKKRGKQ